MCLLLFLFPNSFLSYLVSLIRLPPAADVKAMASLPVYSFMLVLFPLPYLFNSLVMVLQVSIQQRSVCSQQLTPGLCCCPQVDTDLSFPALRDDTFDTQIIKEQILEDMLRFTVTSSHVFSEGRRVREEQDNALL